MLQALGIWQYCVDQFKRTKRSGGRGIQIVLPDFTALPLPEFILLWKDKTERKSIKQENGKNKPDFILIEIGVYWNSTIGEGIKEESLIIQLRYQSPQSIYAIPTTGFNEFRTLNNSKGFPQIVYVPPFSGLEPIEKWQDDGNIRQNVGKGQPGSVLRNLLHRVIDKRNSEGILINPSIKPSTAFFNKLTALVLSRLLRVTNKHSINECILLFCTVNAGTELHMPIKASIFVATSS